MGCPRCSRETGLGNALCTVCTRLQTSIWARFIGIQPHAQAEGQLLYSRQRKFLLLAPAVLMALAIVFEITIRLFGYYSSSMRGSQLRLKSLPSPALYSTPFPHPGFVWYTDAGDGFAIQYPRDWRVLALSQSSGIEFDDRIVPNAICQILVPAPDVLPATERQTALNWVNFELNSLSSKLHNVQYTAASQPAASIGSTTWETRLVSIETPSGEVEIHVYATIHEGQPYIINLLTIMSNQAHVTILRHQYLQRYFQPMLASFRFIRPNQVGEPGVQ